jgi:hypothetical protein
MAGNRIQWLGVLSKHFFDYMAICLTLTTENCSEHETGRSKYEREKSSPVQQLH